MHTVGMQIVATTRRRRSIDLLDARVSVGSVSVNQVSSSPYCKCARVARSLVEKKKNFEFHRSSPPPPNATFRDVSVALNDREKGNFRDKNG